MTPLLNIYQNTIATPKKEFDFEWGVSLKLSYTEGAEDGRLCSDGTNSSWGYVVSTTMVILLVFYWNKEFKEPLIHLSWQMMTHKLEKLTEQGTDDWVWWTHTELS